MSAVSEVLAALGLANRPGAVAIPEGGRLYGPPLPDPLATDHGGAPQIVALPTVNVVAGQQQLNLPAFCREGGSLRIANNGPFDLVVNFGGFSRNLAHGLVDLWQLPPESLGLTITATLGPGQVTGPATLLLDFAYPGEAIEGTYPQVITGATVQIGNSPSVTISSGNVNIGTMPSVVISSGTVTIGNTVTISGSVSITSGTVTIGGTPNINIQSQAVTLNVNQPQTALTDLTFPATGATTQTTQAVPTGTHALGFLGDPTNGLTAVTVKGHTTGRQYFPLDTNIAPAAGLRFFHSAYVLVPVDSAHDTQYDVTGTNSFGVAIVIKVSAILDTEIVQVGNNSMTPVFVVDGTGVGWPGVAVRPQPYDVIGTSSPAAGSQATVTLAAGGASKFYRAHTISGSMSQSAATASNQGVQILDGVTVLFNAAIAVQAAIGASSGVHLADVAYPGSFNTAMTAKLTGTATGLFEAITVGAYLSQN